MIRSQYAQYEDDYYLEDEFYLLNKRVIRLYGKELKNFLKIVNKAKKFIIGIIVEKLFEGIADVTIPFCGTIVTVIYKELKKIGSKTIWGDKNDIEINIENKNLAITSSPINYPFHTNNRQRKYLIDDENNKIKINKGGIIYKSDKSGKSKNSRFERVQIFKENIGRRFVKCNNQIYYIDEENEELYNYG